MEVSICRTCMSGCSGCCFVTVRDSVVLAIGVFRRHSEFTHNSAVIPKWACQNYWGGPGPPAPPLPTALGGPPCSASACVVSHAARVFGIIGNCVSNQIWLGQPLQFSVLEKLTIVLKKSLYFDLIKLYKPCEPFLVTYLIWIQLSTIDCTSQWLYKYKLEQS